MASNIVTLPDVPGIVPGPDDWLGPMYEGLVQHVATGQSPYLFLVDVVHKLYHPTLPLGFRTQLYFHLGLFSVCSLLIVLGLLMRLKQGRLWVFHRLDRTIVLPNASTLFGICALIYAGLGFWLIDSTIKVSKGAGLPRHYTGLRVAWFGAIWSGTFFEIWTTVAGWYVRKYGANHRESTLRSCIAIAIPVVVVLIAWIPPIILCIPHAQRFNRSFRTAQGITAQMLEWQKSWQPGDGIDLAKLMTLFAPGAVLSDELKASHRLKQICSYYCTAVLFLTFLCYVVAASLEILQLGQTVRELRASAAQRLPSSPATNEKTSLSSSTVPALGYGPTSTTTTHSPTSTAVESKYSAGTTSQETHRAPQDEPWALLAWVRRNRIYSAVCIAIMLVTQASVDLWRAVSPLNLKYPSGQFQVEILISCWVHGILATTVSLLLLFRSLDTTSSRFLTRLRTACPWLPFPPAMPNMATKGKNSGSGSSSTSSSSSEEPPMHADARAAAAAAATSLTQTVTLPRAAHLPSSLGGTGSQSFTSVSSSLSAAAAVAQQKHSYGSSHVRPATADSLEQAAERLAGTPEPGRGVRDCADENGFDEKTYLEAVARARERWITPSNKPAQ
ncbi:hypothetical protein RHOSPDRAFT_30887 [Rhodotorula sp. JG-1b]|nr:hypothetical protein RHOSPDRAFT_30887 [Rhodotorula sp. JG-1b]